MSYHGRSKFWFRANALGNPWYPTANGTAVQAASPPASFLTPATRRVILCDVLAMAATTSGVAAAVEIRQGDGSTSYGINVGHQAQHAARNLIIELDNGLSVVLTGTSPDFLVSFILLS